MTTPVVTVTDLLMGPYVGYTAPFGTTEPANAQAAVPPGWTPYGSTQEGLRQIINQTYTNMEVDEVAMPVDARLTQQMVQMATALAEHRLDNYRLALNVAGSGGTNEIQTISLGAATAGTVTLTLNGQSTAPIPYNATAAQIQAALEALSNVNPGDVVVSGGPWPAVVTITFGGQYASADVPAITGVGTGLTGGTVTINTSTPGVAGQRLGISGNLTNSSPMFRAIMAKGLGPGGYPRLVICRRALSTESVENRYSKAGQSFIPITWTGYYVSPSVDAFVIDDRQS
jgi:hypothetical protein